MKWVHFYILIQTMFFVTGCFDSKSPKVMGPESPEVISTEISSGSSPTNREAESSQTLSSSPQAATVTADGGADPSGGEGESADNQLVESSVRKAFEDIPWLFHRISFFFVDSKNADQKRTESIRFLAPCFDNQNGKCKDTVSKTIEIVKRKFYAKNNFTKSKCNASNIKKNEHTSADMSITKNLDLCISYKLSRYPEGEIYRQILALLAHEIAHGLGFGEASSQSLQEWVLDNPKISFISEEVFGQLVRSKVYVDIELNKMLLPLYEPRHINKARVCHGLEEVYKAFGNYLKPFITLRSIESIVWTPSRIEGYAFQVYDHVIGKIMFDHCHFKNKDMTVTYNEIATGLLDFSDKLSILNHRFARYLEGTNQRTPLGSYLSPSTVLKLLLYNEDLNNIALKKQPRHFSRVALQCSVKNEKTSYKSSFTKVHKKANPLEVLEVHRMSMGNGFELTDEKERGQAFEPIKIGVARHRLNGALALSISLDNRMGDLGKVSLISSNADRIRMVPSRFNHPTVFKVMKPGDNFTARFKFGPLPHKKWVPAEEYFQERRDKLSGHSIEVSCTTNFIKY